MVTRPRRALAFPLALASALAGCDPAFESPSIVIDLRILGMRADPPEVVEELDLDDPVLPDVPPVTVSVLVADPGTERRLTWRLSACAPTEERRCDPDDPIVVMGEGVSADPESAEGASITAVLDAGPALLMAAFEGDQNFGLGGLQVMVVASIWPEDRPEAEAIFGAKLVVYSPRIPPERVANTNPTVEAIVLSDEEPWSGGPCSDPMGVPHEIAVGTEIRMEPVEPAGVRETYVLPTLDGGSRTITENLRYSWFATSGSFSAERTGGATDFFGNAPPLHTYFTAPADVRLVSLWLVQRDERGGASFTERCLQTTAP
jgi:hypothetical protein